MIHTTRRAAAGAAVLLWAGGLATLAYRQQKPSGLSGAMTLAATRFNPGTAYYLVERDGKQVGFASSTADTTATNDTNPKGLVFSDYLILQSHQDSTRRMAVASQARVSRTFVLQRLDVMSDTSTGWYRETADVGADSMLAFRAVSPPGASRTARAEHDLLAPDAIPMLVGMGTETAPRVGTTIDVKVVDAGAGRIAPVTFRVAAESLFSIADSAVYDSAAHQWRAATTDTLRAWRLVPNAPLLAAMPKLTAWVDGQGHVVDADAEIAGAGVLRFRRMCYELAYRNWPGRRFK